MDTEDIMRLFSKSTALIVDDEVNDKRTRIYKIRGILEDKCISFVTYSDIPPHGVWESFGYLSFLIIDWNLKSSEDVSGASIGSELIRQRENDILDFVEYMTTHYFMPVFLFTQENLTPIKGRILERDALKRAFAKGQVVIRAKSGLNAQNIEKLVDWLHGEGKKVMVQSVPPFGFEEPKRAKWYELNKYIKEVVAPKADAFFENTGFLGVEGESYKTIYGGHPNAEGCEVWASTLYPTFKKFLEEQTE